MPAPKQQKLRVVLVEDSSLTEQQIREIICSVSVPTDICSVDTPAKAIAACKDFKPHAVLLDLQLRKGTGFSVLSEFKNQTPRPTFIVMTNYALPNYKNFAFLSGADLFLDKATDLDALKGLLESVAARNGLT